MIMIYILQNKLVKFDGDGFEPIYYDDGSRYKLSSLMEQQNLEFGM